MRESQVENIGKNDKKIQKPEIMRWEGLQKKAPTYKHSKYWLILKRE
jgi:hypothetical protein